jgi:hypothetical protein
MTRSETANIFMDKETIDSFIGSTHVTFKSMYNINVKHLATRQISRANERASGNVLGLGNTFFNLF